MSTVFVVFPIHLFKNIKELKKYDDVIVVEDPLYFTKYEFHKIKLCFHRASMKKYTDYLKKNNINVTYFNFNDNYFNYLKDKNVTFYDPVDHDLIEEFTKKSKKYKFTFNVKETLMFATTKEQLQEYHDEVFNKKFALTSSFYRWQRKTMKIMYPIGKKYKLSYDKENREPFEKNQKDVFKPKIQKNKYVTEAIKYVNKYFNKNFGELNEFVYPIDHKEAQKWLDNFIKIRFEKFGIFEDAFNKDIKYGYHSVLSPLINVGLLTDNEILSKILPLKDKIPIGSFEGYIRQLIGWKQGIRYLYQFHYDKFYDKNYLKHKNKISLKIWNGETGIPPVDDCIKKLTNTGYLHHIERLMIMGNFFLITMVDPKEVFDWFISIVSMDAYQWVMYPNVYGMITYADEGFMMSRPYMSSSTYLKKMGNYEKDKSFITLDNKEYLWSDVWDALYYNFINKHYDLIKGNYFTSRNAYHWDKKSEKQKKEMLKTAKLYLDFIF